MTYRLEGHVALVTGSTSGIGAATAEAFARAGATVVVTGRRADEGLRVASQIGPGATFIRADITDDAEAIRLVSDTVERFGRIDCLVNNAGSPGHAVSITDLDLDHFDDAMAVHVRAPLLLIQQVAPHMMSRRSGSIVNVASVSGLRSGFSGHDYSIAKAALIHLTRCAAVELAQSEIRVNTISPGPVATGIFAKAAGADTGSADAGSLLARLLPTWQPDPHIGRPVDIAEVAVFLATDGARLINGQNIAVDGALSAGRPWSTVVRERETIARILRDETQGT